MQGYGAQHRAQLPQRATQASQLPPRFSRPYHHQIASHQRADQPITVGRGRGISRRSPSPTPPNGVQWKASNSRRQWADPSRRIHYHTALPGLVEPAVGNRVPLSWARLEDI